MKIKVLIHKNKTVVYNYSFKIIGTDNVPNATIAAAIIMCNLNFVIAAKGDTLTSSLGAGHNGVLTSKTRNLNISKFITILNKFKDKTGLYTIVLATKRNWSEFYGDNIVNEDLVVVPAKKVILPTIEAYLYMVWCNEWSRLSSHRQSKFWFTKPDPILATKLMNMSRENLGKSIQFLSGHGWRKEHLTTANLSGNQECRLCCEEGSEEIPIHIFSECDALADTRRILFSDPYPTQQVGRESLCKVVELIFIDTVCNLIDSEQNFNVNSTD